VVLCTDATSPPRPRWALVLPAPHRQVEEALLPGEEVEVRPLGLHEEEVEGHLLVRLQAEVVATEVAAVVAAVAVG